MKKGMLQEKYTTARKLKSMEISDMQIAEGTELSFEDIKKL
jgi:hypothetical protein